MKLNPRLKKFAMAGYVVAAIGAVGAAIALSHRKQGAAKGPKDKAAQADSPTQLPKVGWKRALNETKRALKDKNIPMLAAGVAFFATLAFFPSVAAFTSIYSVAASDEQVMGTVKALESSIPREMAQLVTNQLTATLDKPAAGILVGALAIVLAIWGASAGVQNLINATNKAYDVDESRGFVKMKLTSIALVIGGLVVAFPLLFLLTVQGDWLAGLGIPEGLMWVFFILRWVLIVAIMAIALAAFYRYGPDRKNAKWQWVSWGAAAAIIIWLIGTLLFFFYAQNFGSFGKNYGVVAGLIILMTWFNLSSFIFLLGAQVNHGLEKQTSADTDE